MDDIYVKQYGNRASETRRNSGLKGQKWALLASAISLGMVFMETQKSSEIRNDAELLLGLSTTVGSERGGRKNEDTHCLEV